MTVWGEILTGRVPADGGGGGLETGILVFFILLFVLALGVLGYIELRKRKEGLQDDDKEGTDNDQDADTKDDMESGESSPFNNIEEPRGPEEALPRTKQTNSPPPEEPKQENGVVKGIVRRLSNKFPSKRNNSGSEDEPNNEKEPKPAKESSRKNLMKSLSAKLSFKKGKEDKIESDDQDNNDSIKKHSTSSSKGPAKPRSSSKEPPKRKNSKRLGRGSSHHSRSSRSKKMDADLDDDEILVDATEILPGGKFEAYDETKGDSKAQALLKYHRQGDWEQIRDFFQKIRRRIIERQHYMALLVKFITADWPGPIKKDTVFCKYLDEWSAAEPENLQCNVLRLEVWAAWAWHGRTTAFAHEIPPERVELFYDRMDSAAAELSRVLAVSKKRDALLYAAAIKVATGRNDDQAVVQEYMEAVQASNDPANYIFHTRAMEYFCEKWHGSHREMLNYANWITEQLPDGHPLWILIPAAHYEIAALLDNAAQRTAYWHKQQDAILAAYEKALVGPWETKVNDEVSPACKKLDAIVRNWFAYALGKTGSVEQAQTQARVIGKTPVAELPWDERYTYIKHIKTLGFIVEGDSVVV
mmetsp:Transcript_4062/g.8230  ORF Transcript_4062/g.8230 Transcript_4062/m.8230 type:complete len:586 (-) Transcript_4062:217-1974(-)